MIIVNASQYELELRRSLVDWTQQFLVGESNAHSPDAGEFWETPIDSEFYKAPDEIFDTFAFCWLRLGKREGFSFSIFFPDPEKIEKIRPSRKQELSLQHEAISRPRPCQRNWCHSMWLSLLSHPITLSVASCFPDTEVGSGYVIQAPSTSVRPIGSPKEARWIYSFSNLHVSMAWNLSASFAFGHHGITQWKHVLCLSKAFGTLETQVTWTNQCVSNLKRQWDFHIFNFH